MRKNRFVFLTLATFCLAVAGLLAIANIGFTPAQVAGGFPPPDPWELAGGFPPPDPWELAGGFPPPDPWELAGGFPPPDPWEVRHV